MSRVIAALGLVLLLSCGKSPEPVSTASFRAADTPIYSAAVVDDSRLVGHWHQVVAFAPTGQTDCTSGDLDISRGAGGGLQALWALCLAAGRVDGQGPMQMVKPGRYDLALMPTWWILWVDADYRTLVIGTPSGQLGLVLNRDTVLPADRLKAAGDILRFNGYDLDAMKVF